jgi:hypothetical protein
MPITLNSLFEWIEATRLARGVANSASLTAWLSAVHVIGFAIVMGSALVGNLRALGILLTRSTVGDVLRPANRAIILGLAISASTGALLFSARATDAAANGFFQLKMLLLVAATTFQFTVDRHRADDGQRTVRHVRAVAAVALSLWLGLALAACAFILLE